MIDSQKYNMITQQQKDFLTRRVHHAYMLQRVILATLYFTQCTAIALSCAFVLFLMDRLTGFPVLLRILLSVFILAWCFLWRPLRRKHLGHRNTVAEAAYFEQLALNNTTSGFDAVLVSATEFSRNHDASGGSAELRNQVIHIASDSDFNLYPLILQHLRQSCKSLIFLFAVLAVYVCWAAIDAETLGIFFRRCCGMQVKYKTMTYITESLSPKFTEQYKNVEIRVKAGGRLPTDGKLEVQYPEGKPLSLELERDTEKTDEYSAIVPEPADSFRYVLRLGDYVSDTYTMQVIPPPVITSASNVQIVAPVYTKRPERTVPLGPIESCEGANLTFSICSDRELASCRIHLSDDKEFDAVLQKDSGIYRVKVPDLPAGSMTYLVTLTDTYGIHNREQIAYPLVVRPDKLPIIRVNRPQSGLYVADISTLRYHVELSDDYGLDTLSITYQVRRDHEGEDSEEAESTIIRTGNMDLKTLLGETSAVQTGTIDFKHMGMLPDDVAVITFLATDNKKDRSDPENIYGKSDSIEVRMVTAARLRELLLEEQTGVHRQLSDITVDMKNQHRILEQLDKKEKSGKQSDPSAKKDKENAESREEGGLDVENL